MNNDTPLKKVFFDNRIAAERIPIDSTTYTIGGKEYVWRGKYIRTGPKLDRYELWEVK